MCATSGAPTQKWTVEAQRITTGIRYPASINTTHLTSAQAIGLLDAIAALGDPSPEEWVTLRAGAADARLGSLPELASSIAALWGEDAVGHSLVGILAFEVGALLCSTRASHDLGTHPDRLDDVVATRVLAERILVAPAFLTGDGGPAAAKALARRLAGAIRRHDFEAGEELDEAVDGTGSRGRRTDAPEEADGVVDRVVIEDLARRLEARGDTAATRVAGFLRSPELWPLTSEEVADRLGITAVAWRKSQSRAYGYLRTTAAGAD